MIALIKIYKINYYLTNDKTIKIKNVKHYEIK
jgi:hypothetical protein